MDEFYAKTKIITPINALPSWEGYEYQGHCALNVSLEKLCDLLKSIRDFSKWCLQLEGTEDFAILEDGKYKSLHQVKRGEVSLKDNDKFAFVISILESNADYGYFHITTDHKITKDFLNKTLLQIKQLKENLKKELKCKDDLLPSDNENEYIIIENIKLQSVKGSIYQILNYVCDGNKDFKLIQTKIDEIKVILTAYEAEINSKIEAFKRDNPTCDVDECILSEWKTKYDNSITVRLSSIEIIKSILSKECPDWDFVNNSYCLFVYDKLVSATKNCITNYLKNKEHSSECLIQFSDIYNILTKNHIAEFETIDYKYFLVKKSIEGIFEDFPYEICNNSGCINCVTKESCNLKEQMDVFLKSNNEEKQKFIFNLLLEAPKKINNLPNDDLIKWQLLNALKEISKLKTNDKKVICAMLIDKGLYYLSLDDSRDQNTLRKKLQNGIKESVDKSLLYECDTLITDRLNEKFFKIDGSDVNVLEDAQLNELKAITNVDINDEIANCTKPKVIRLVDLNAAKGDLC